LLLDDFFDDCNDPLCWVFLDSSWDGEAELDSGVEFNKGFKELGPLTVMIHGSSKSLSFLPESSLKSKPVKCINTILSIVYTNIID